MEYRLIYPRLDMYAAHAAYLAEWEATGMPVVPWAAGLGGMEYDAWLVNIELLRNGPPAPYVPSSLYAFVDGRENLLGFLDLRHRLNDTLLQMSGHIGYGLRPVARGQGLAPVMLGLGLEEARKIGIDRVLVSCDKENPASARTILHCGGVLEDERMQEDGHILQRYWIELL